MFDNRLARMEGLGAPGFPGKAFQSFLCFCIKPNCEHAEIILRQRRAGKQPLDPSSEVRILWFCAPTLNPDDTEDFERKFHTGLLQPTRVPSARDFPA